ncbi:hypothetical protein DC28_08365 [Spirochaeta lutea]|uniref:Fur family transcriptional regulator n=2 Tax=Spirochaeta lutea TaxID=1480694 RepID=A0A098QZF1_9SPIO|nr:hypothetical protein DC28_08365 [Spirochaeta lutea]
MDALSVLRDHDLSPSYPRKRILEYLMDYHNHPTVGQIYQDLVGDIPSLSKTTVYNTLKTFVERHIAEVITIEGKENRYDLYNPETHAHFKCESCGNVFDISVGMSLLSLPDLQGFEVHDHSVHFNGFCPSCLGSA